MTGRDGDDFAIPREPRALLNALESAQRKYEAAKNASETATVAENRATENRKRLKRLIINKLRGAGMSDSRSDKEYVDDVEWQDNERDIEDAKEAKRSSDDDESIARQRMLTLRASILPVTTMLLIRMSDVKFDAEGITQHVDAAMSSAEDDPAHSADASVAHNA